MAKSLILLAGTTGLEPATFPPLLAGRTNQIFKELLAFSLFKLSFSPHR